MRISPKQLLHGLFYSTPVLLLALTACGGGGGGGSSGVASALTATATPTAQILAVSSPMASFSPLTASGGTLPYTYTHTGALPPGVTMVPSTGVVSGTPTAATASAVAMTFSVRDANNAVALTTSTVNFSVFPAWPGTQELGVATTRGLSSATDGNGNIYVAGYTTGALDSNTQMGPTDFYLTKYDASGSKVYTKQLGVASATTIGYAAATDASSNVYVAGSTTGSLGTNTLTGSTDMFLARYDSSGTPPSSNPIIQLGAMGATTIGYAAATDASGNVYVAGSTTGALGNNTVTGSTDMFLAKYDASGNIVYTKQLGDPGSITSNTYGQSVATDASGNIYVAGYTDGDLINHTGSSAGATDFFLTKYNASGIIVYTRQLGVSGVTANTQALSVATDASGNVYVAGYTEGGLDGNQKTGLIDFFLTKYTSGGARVYTKQLGMPGATTYGVSVATDAYGNVYLAGNTNKNLVNGGSSTGTSDSFLIKYTASGTRVYTQQLGVTGQSTSGNAVATYANGNVFVAGDTNGSLDGTTTVAPGGQDFFLTKYDANGINQ